MTVGYKQKWCFTRNTKLFISLIEAASRCLCILHSSDNISNPVFLLNKKLFEWERHVISTVNKHMYASGICITHLKQTINEK